MKILITGASRGIGKGIATFLGRNGFHLGLLARSADLLRETADAVRAEGGTAAFAPCDIRDPEAVERAVHQLAEELGGADGLINNAGLVIQKSVFDLSLEEWRAMLETNVSGMFYATRAVLPYLQERRKGHIINISSISGRLPLAGGSAYAATKYAVTGFSESLFLEVREFGIKVTTIFPGSVATRSHRHDAEEDAEWKVRPEEVGAACRDILNTAPGNCVSRLEIRPLIPPPK